MCVQHWFPACDKLLLMAVLQEGLGNWGCVLDNLTEPPREELTKEMQHLAAGLVQPGTAVMRQASEAWLAARAQVCWRHHKQAGTRHAFAAVVRLSQLQSSIQHRILPANTPRDLSLQLT